MSVKLWCPDDVGMVRAYRAEGMYAPWDPEYSKDLEFVARSDYDALAAELAEWRNGSAQVNGKLLDRIAQLEAALRKYGHHLAECDYIVEMLPCTCGLDEVRAALNSGHVRLLR